MSNTNTSPFLNKDTPQAIRSALSLIETSVALDWIKWMWNVQNYEWEQINPDVCQVVCTATSDSVTKEVYFWGLSYHPIQMVWQKLDSEKGWSFLRGLLLLSYITHCEYDDYLDDYDSAVDPPFLDISEFAERFIKKHLL